MGLTVRLGRFMTQGVPLWHTYFLWLPVTSSVHVCLTTIIPEFCWWSNISDPELTKTWPHSCVCTCNQARTWLIKSMILAWTSKPPISVSIKPLCSAWRFSLLVHGVHPIKSLQIFETLHIHSMSHIKKDCDMTHKAVRLNLIGSS